MPKNSGPSGDSADSQGLSRLATEPTGFRDSIENKRIMMRSSRSTKKPCCLRHRASGLREGAEEGLASTASVERTRRNPGGPRRIPILLQRTHVHLRLAHRPLVPSVAHQTDAGARESVRARVADSRTTEYLRSNSGGSLRGRRESAQGIGSFPARELRAWSAHGPGKRGLAHGPGRPWGFRARRREGRVPVSFSPRARPKREVLEHDSTCRFLDSSSPALARRR